MQSCSWFAFLQERETSGSDGERHSMFFELVMDTLVRDFTFGSKDLTYSHSPLYTIPMATPVITYKETQCYKRAKHISSSL